MGFPTYMYRKDGNKVVAEVFDSDDIPKGWVDCPEKAERAEEKPKRGRPKKVKDVDNDV